MGPLRVPLVLSILALLVVATSATASAATLASTEPRADGGECVTIVTGNFINQVEDDPVGAVFNSISINMGCDPIVLVWSLIP